MNKKELIQAVSHKSSITKDQATKVVNEITGSITQALIKGEEVKINDFGTFQITDKKERKGRNPQTGEEITISASKTPQFKASKVLKDIINQKSFIEKFVENGKLTEVEAKVLTYVFEISKRIKKANKNSEELVQIDVKDIAENLKMSFKETEMIANRLIGKRILNTMVYYSEVDSVYLRANYRKYL